MKKLENSTVAGSIHFINMTAEIRVLAENNDIPDGLIRHIGEYIDSHAWEFEMETVQLFRELLHL